VLDMPDAPAEQKADALLCRGLTKGKMGQHAAAVSDFDAVLDMPDAPAEQKAGALVNRGVAKGEMGDDKGEIEDCTAVLGMQDAPAEQKSRAYGSLGWVAYKGGDYTQCIAHSRKGLGLAPDLHYIRSNLGLALLHLGSTEEALAEYEKAIAEMSDPSELENLVAKDLREALEKKPDLPGADKVMEMVVRRRRELGTA